MRIITPEKLDNILVKHLLWLDDPHRRAGKRADLFLVNLSHADLTDVNLIDANLRGANLFGADLSGVWLYGGDLTDANLTNANLSGANLSYSNLVDTNLIGVNLAGANLTGVHLAGAKFGLNIIDAASIYHATFSEDALEWLICREDWAKVKDTVKIVDN